MMENYSIIDMNGYAESMRKSVAESFSEDYSENLDEFISIQQVKDLVEQHSLGQDEEGYHIINEEVFNDIFDDLREWLYGVGLAKLAAKGHIECAWDNNINEMVFWLPEKDEANIKDAT